MHTQSLHALALILSLGGAISLAGCADSSDTGGSGADSGSDSSGTDGDSGNDSGGSTSGASGDGDGDGDGDGSDGGDTGGSDTGDTGSEVDDTPPEVVSVSPEQGAAGVLADAVIVVQFSEPMDKVATQAAWQSVDIPAADVTFSWNDMGDELTVTPDDYLEWSFVEDPSEPAIEYAFTITSAATDLAGNELPADFESSFTTMRGQNIWLLPNPSLTGFLSTGDASGTFFDGQVMWVGDSGVQGMVNGWYTGFISIDLDALPEETIGLAGATLVAAQHAGSGDPYGNLQGLRLEHMDFTELGPAALEGAPEADLGVISTDMNPEIIEVDVLDAVAADFDADGPAGSTEFRLRFQDNTNGDGLTDRLYFGTEDIAMLVTAAYP